MTEAELELLRWKARASAAEMLLEIALAGAAKHLPFFRQAFVESASQNVESSFRKVILPGYSPEYSDMVAGEFQEAFEALLKRIQS